MENQRKNSGAEQEKQRQSMQRAQEAIKNATKDMKDIKQKLSQVLFNISHMDITLYQRVVGYIRCKSDKLITRARSSIILHYWINQALATHCIAMNLLIMNITWSYITV